MRALVAAGREAEAEKLARTFLENHPDSIFKGLMRRIVRNSPDASSADADD
ncbi:MAG: hypothetical protein ABEN55_02205 [Bradymonadaceae bacterium]